MDFNRKNVFLNVYIECLVGEKGQAFFRFFIFMVYIKNVRNACDIITIITTLGDMQD
jgi:hypothetical protein